MTKRTPQEKKALSYAKDGRNTLHENDKASRRLIPLGKARARRAYRKRVSDILRIVPDLIERSDIELVEAKAASVERIEWEKYPDTPLGKVVERQKERRESHAGSGKTARKKIREFVANLKIETEQETDGRWIAEASEGVTVLVYGDTREKAIERCKHFAGLYYMEEIGAGKILSIDGDTVSIVSY
jgi:hypothetical protein